MTSKTMLVSDGKHYVKITKPDGSPYYDFTAVGEDSLPLAINLAHQQARRMGLSKGECNGRAIVS